MKIELAVILLFAAAALLPGCTVDHPIRSTIEAARNGTYYSAPHQQVSLLEAAYIEICYQLNGDWHNAPNGSCTNIDIERPQPK